MVKEIMIFASYIYKVGPGYLYCLVNGGSQSSLASSPDHSQILSHSYGEKLGEGLGSLLHHRPEMVNTVST